MLAYTAATIAQEETADERSITIGTELDYPPYSFFDKENKPGGFNVEVTQAVAETMDLDVKIKIGPWGDIREALETGKINGIAGMYHSKERDKLVDFSTPYTIVHHAIFGRSNAPKITEEEDLRGKQIIVMRGDIMHDYVLEKGLSNNPIVVDTQVDALRLLASGKHDYALLAKLPGLYWIKKLELPNIKITGLLIRPSKYCYAVKEGDTALLARLNEGLAIIKETGQYQHIYDKWLGVLEPTKISRKTILKVIGFFISVVILLLSGSVVWTRALRRQVSQRTKKLQEEITARTKAENSLTESEEKLKGMLGSISDYMSMMDKDLNVLWANEAAEKIFGDDIVGRKCYEVYHRRKEPCEPYPCLTLKAFQDGKVHGHDTQAIDKDGKPIYFHCTASVALKNKDDSPAAVIEVSRDITGQKRSEEKLLEKMHELERFHRGVVGREEKMIELKGRIVELENKLGEKT